ncbi:hypothetical protein [Brevundimonas nasdae]|uniref:hypothetical protein n=1 Tax=Brevundimonas nasdae TaxID=172043 RepID=UPI00289F30A0|nr:hypothetical protein [Brevundimonas nasdae]
MVGPGTALLVLLILGGLLALLFHPVSPPTHFVDKDADGEPDEPDGPAAGL